MLFVVTLAGGGLVTFLPIERPDGALATTALLLFGVTGALTRWRAGLLADRFGSGRGLTVAVAGRGRGRDAAHGRRARAGAGWILLGAALFGAGYGAAQNLTLLAAFARAGAGGTTSASAMWNVAFDAGTAVGALVLGLVAAGIGLDWTFVVVAAALVAVVPVAGRDRRTAVSQPSGALGGLRRHRMKRISSPELRSQVRSPSTSPRLASRS